MKLFNYYLTVLIFFFSLNAAAQFNFDRSWGTYFGDERFYFTDSAIDSEGSLYITGTVLAEDSATLPVFTDGNSYNQYYNGGISDGFLIKFNPEGAIVWSTFIGGENEDKLTAIDIDDFDNIYIIGDTDSKTGISTAGSYQEGLAGGKDLFISKFTGEGTILWCTYYGGESFDYEGLPSGSFNYSSKRTHIVTDGNGSFYIAAVCFSQNLSTSGVFQELRGTSNQIIAKFDDAGTRLWATYFGVDTYISSIKANATALYVTGRTTDCPPNHSYNTYYGTPNGFQPLPRNCTEVYLTKFSADSGQRDWSTYYGGNMTENVYHNSIALHGDTVYLSGLTPCYADEEIATNGSYQPICVGQSNFIAKFNQDGSRISGTYNGNSSEGDNSSGNPGSNVFADGDGSIYNFGVTGHINITTAGAYKETFSDSDFLDGYVCKFDSEGNKVWGTYYGGEGQEYNVRFHTYDGGSKFYVLGATQSSNEIATEDALQPTKQLYDPTNNDLNGVINIFIAHFEPKTLSTTEFDSNEFSVFPNPNNGSFTVKSAFLSGATLMIFDVLGKKLFEQKLSSNESVIDSRLLVQGVYVLKITKDAKTYNSKIIVN